VPVATRLDASGSFPRGWPAAGLFAVSVPEPRLGQALAMDEDVAPDGLGGCYIAWVTMGEFCSNSCYGEPGHVRVQHLLASGAVARGWPASGVVASEKFLGYVSTGVIIAPDGQHGLLLVSDGWAQRIGPSGNLRWGDGLVVHKTASWTSLPQLTPDGDGGAYVFWGDGAGEPFPSGRIFGQHISTIGRLDWGPAGTPLSGRYGLGLGSPSALTVDRHEAVVAWSGQNSAQTGTDVFALRVTRSGARPWGAERVVCGALTDQFNVRLVGTPRGGIILAWHDTRAVAGVFAQSLDRLGRPRWQADGVPVCPGSGDRFQLAMAPDASGGAFLAWGDHGPESELRAARITSDGTLAAGWPADGAPLCKAPADRPLTQMEFVTLTATRKGEAIVAWQDERIYPGTITDAEMSFAMLLRSDGPAALARSGPVPAAGPAAGTGTPAPQHFEFALRGVFPNPSTRAASVRFSLAAEGEATLETFDVSGRRVAERSWFAHAGPAELPLAEGQRLPPGVYLVRLRQREHSATSRAIVLP
jgi:hypothetical protein